MLIYGLTMVKFRYVVCSSSTPNQAKPLGGSDEAFCIVAQ
jgi:hypothetical protein